MTSEKTALFGAFVALAEVHHRLHVVHDDCESCAGTGRIESYNEESEECLYRKCLDCRGSGHGEQCFNLFTFLEELPMKLEGSPEWRQLGKFELDPVAVARFLYCHMAMQSGDSPDGTTFRGMPILD